MIDCASERENDWPQILHVGNHTLRADIGPHDGSDTAPTPHDLFDSALASCKALTTLWYARRKKIPLERVETHVERDDSEERKGKYVLKVRLEFHGPLTDEQRAELHSIAARCPVHKLMTTTEVVIETAPLDAK